MFSFLRRQICANLLHLSLNINKKNIELGDNFQPQHHGRDVLYIFKKKSHLHQSSVMLTSCTCTMYVALFWILLHNLLQL